MTFEERQQLLRLVVERVTVEYGVARVETVIPLEKDNLRHRCQDERFYSRRPRAVDSEESTVTDGPNRGAI